MNRWDKHRHLKIFIFPPISSTESVRSPKKSSYVGEKIQSIAKGNVRSFSFTLMAMNFFKRKIFFLRKVHHNEPQSENKIAYARNEKLQRDENPIYFSIAAKKFHHQDERRKRCRFAELQIYIQSNCKCPEIYLLKNFVIG